jgi:hypothetical protein
MGEQRAWQRRREGVEAILTRIATDPGYRRNLKDDPATALQGLANEPAAEAPAEVFGLCKSVTCQTRSCRISYVTR